MSAKPSWLSRNLADDPSLAAADAAAERLGAEVCAQLRAAGDRLALQSEALAVDCYRSAAEAWTAFGPAGFARWVACGEALSAEAPSCKVCASNFFAQAPGAFGPGGADTAAAWCALGRELIDAARHLGPTFFARTASVLQQPDGLLRLHRWVRAGLELLGRQDFRAGLLAEAFFESAPQTAASLAHPLRALEAALALADAIEPRQFFASLPATLAGFNAEEQADLLGCVARLASDDARAANVVYQHLPLTAAGLAAAPRAELFALLPHFPERCANALAKLAPALATTLAAVPSAELGPVLARTAMLAEGHPEAALAALGRLPELYRRAQPHHVAAWFDAGIRLASENAAGAHSYFALESRTSANVLRTLSSAAELEDNLGVWRKLIEMISDRDTVIRRLEAPSLLPPLERAPDEGTVAMPERIAWLPSREQNLAVYRFLALQLAGRREFGTYAPEVQRRNWAPRFEALFGLAEGVRIAHRVSLAYPGSARETQQLAAALLERWRDAPAGHAAAVSDALLAAALARSQAPAWLQPTAAEAILRRLASLQSSHALLRHSLAVAAELSSLFDALEGADPGLDPSLAQDSEPSSAAPSPTQPGAASTGGATPVSSAEPAQQLEAVEADVDPAAGDPAAGEAEDGSTPAPPARRARRKPAHAQSYVYDEWDHTIADYRSAHCRVHELQLRSDSGAFFERTVHAYRHILSQVRNQFERMRPDRYRPLRGLEDGEDFDLNALTDARIEARLGRTPSTRIYTARTRQMREVATLFLLDMSASTEQPFAEPGEQPARRRIIDTLKEALVVLTTALDVLGDSYAIYGFSSQGRNQVEVYPVKAFDEALDAEVRARIGGIEPKHGTRMGAALRHSLTKFARVHAQSKHLVLLSDGFPQDQEYGPDRRSHTYGIVDTAVALRELHRAGTTPFCLTVDRAGQDYLRHMCSGTQYMVIDEVDELPRELPKIYRRIVPS